MVQYTDISELKSRITKHTGAPYSFQSIHGCNSCCFENIAFCIGFMQDEIDDKDITDFYELYLQRFASTDDVIGSDFVKSMVLNGILFMGKRLGSRDGAVSEAFHERLSRLCGFAASGKAIFYTAEERKLLKAIPQVWKNCEVVRYENTNPYLRLPIVYDLLGFNAMYGIDSETDAKIEAVVRFVLGERYQSDVKHGYGIGINGENCFLKSRYYAVGWDINLSRSLPKEQMLYMRLLSPISAARHTQWYQANLARYKKAVTEDDDSLLSELYMSARKTYWTGGCYMSFGRGKAERKSNVIRAINELPQ